jgi:hypothetical protein
MAPTSAAARFLLLTTLILALAGDILLRVEPWGLNFTVVSLLLFGGIGLLSRRLHDPIPIEAWLIAGFGLLSAAFFSWRDSPELGVINFLATLAAAILVTARKRPGELLRMTFFDHFYQSLIQVIHVSVGFVFLLLRDLRGGSGEGEGQLTRRGRVWLGIALAIPALLLFGSLLTSADATFEYLITDVLRIDIWTLMGHAALIAFLTWTVGGWLRGRFLATEFASSPILFPRKISLGVTEIAIVLGSLDVLFGTFVALQISYFFGGHAAILGTPSLTYAEYARRGFFELIAVAALSLPLLVTADWLFRAEHARERRLIRALSIVMVALLGVMLVSAMHRLSLYMEAYGLTTSRVHAAAILIWIALTLLLFCATVLRQKRNLLPFAMAVSGYIVLMGMNALNPDALVARVNMTRMVTDGKFDPKYTFGLSADAVPVFLDAIPAMQAVHRSALAERLLQHYASPEPEQDIRTWNAARATAASLVRGREGELRGYVLPPETSGSPARTSPSSSFSHQ